MAFGTTLGIDPSEQTDGSDVTITAGFSGGQEYGWTSTGYTSKRCWEMHTGAVSGNIYAGLGTNIYEAELAVSYDNGVNWETLYDFPVDRRIMSVCELSDGSVM